MSSSTRNTPTTGGTGFAPVVARTRTAHAAIDPVAYDCIKVVVVRSGSAIMLSEFGEKPVNVGDVVLLGPNTLCGSEPEDWITVTILYLDTDYMVDQVFWQHASILADRLDAQGFAETKYAEPAQVLRLGEDRAGSLMPWLDELVALSVEGDFADRFYRMQSLLFAVLDVLAPFIKVTPIRTSVSPQSRTRPTQARLRCFHPSRAEAARVRDLLRDSITNRWTLDVLAERVHLSSKQLSRLFVDAYGKTPLAYLTMLRVDAMARLLRETDVSIAVAGRAVGWDSRSRATEAFRECVGVTPQRYRILGIHPDRA